MAKNREEHERIRDRMLVRDYFLNGMSQSEIADKLNSREDVEYTVTQQTVSYDINVLKEEWKQKTAFDLDQMKAREADYLEHLYRENMRGWIRSQDDIEKHRRKVKRRAGEADRENQPTEQELTTESQNKIGDPRFLSEAREIRSDIRKLWGIDAPQKVDHSGFIAHPTDLTDDEEKRIKAMINGSA